MLLNCPIFEEIWYVWPDIAETESTHIDPTTGEPLYDTPLDFSGSYDHLNLWRDKKAAQSQSKHPYGIFSGSRLLESVEEEGRKYKKKSGGKGKTQVYG